MELKKLRLRFRNNFWAMPIIYGFISIFVVIVVYLIDKWLLNLNDPSFFQQFKTSNSVAKKLYSSLITAILTMTTISFSVIMVVLTTYSAQFSPRTLKNFMKSKVTRHVLGVYTFGFIYALLNLLIVSTEEQLFRPIFMVLFAISNLALFIYFIHNIASEVQVNQLIANLREDGGRMLASLKNKKRPYKEFEDWNEEVVSRLEESVNFTIYAERSGYVQYIDWIELFNWTKEKDIQFISHIDTGDFVLKREPLLSINVNQSTIDENRLTKQYAKKVLIGYDRSEEQDFEFIIEKLVEVALKAISPSNNDPHTAINCINRVGSLLIESGQEFKEVRFLIDESDQLRIIKPTRRFEDLLYKSFYQLKHSGRSDVSVMFAILEVLYKIAYIGKAPLQKEIGMYYNEIVDAIDWKAMSRLDKKKLNEVIEQLNLICRP